MRYIRIDKVEPGDILGKDIVDINGKVLLKASSDMILSENIIAKIKERNIKVHISDSIIDDMVVLTRYKEFGARKIDQILEDKVDDTIIDSILEGKTNIYVNNHS